MRTLLVAVAALAGQDLGPEEFGRLHALIRRQPGEQRHLEIDWAPTPLEAQRRAAAEGKPILILTHVGDPMGHI